MIYRQLPRIGIPLSVIGLGGHEYLPDGKLRGFQEDFTRSTTPGQSSRASGEKTAPHPEGRLRLRDQLL